MQITVVLSTFSNFTKYINRLPLIKGCLISLKNQTFIHRNHRGNDPSHAEDYYKAFINKELLKKKIKSLKDVKIII